MKKVSTDSYKGVRDFYPYDAFVQEYMFETISSVLRTYGYEKYDASILESAELYRAKSGEEIVNEQTYTFKDRGDREVTLRPEMTPTVARMVAKKRRELPLPIRWFSIPNLFRYERPQRGRLREHWQLNVDMFGGNAPFAEVEILSIVNSILTRFGIQPEQFQIRLNNRKAMEQYWDSLGLSADTRYKLAKLIDKKEKNSTFEEDAETLLGFRYVFPEHPDSEVQCVIDHLREIGISNAVYDPTLMRGFDYYTGTVFEVYDLHPKNNRSLFGGGRFDELLDMFGAEPLPTVGFGMGDVTLRDVLETYNLLPEYKAPATLGICPLSKNESLFCIKISERLRKKGISSVVDYTGRPLGKQILSLESRGIAHFLVVGESEIQTNTAIIKNMSTREETAVNLETLEGFIFKQ